MKKILVLVLLMCSQCFALKPVIVRDKFTSAAYQVYVPADSTGTYWARWTLGWPGSTQNVNYPIQRVMYGKVYTGSALTASNTTAAGSISAKVGTWTLDERYGWQTWYNNGDNTRYLEWDIPDGHNRIHALIRYSSGCDTVNIHLGSTVNPDAYDSELTVTSVDTSTGTYACKEIAIATNSTSTSRKLRIQKTTDTKYVYLVGIRTFNTNLVGAPSTASGGIATGHNLICLLDGFNESIQKWTPVSGYSDMVMYDNTCEFTISWKPHAESTYKWTAYGAHYDGAAFTPSANPSLYVDGTLIGDMSNTTTVPLGTLYEGDSITEYASGYGAWDADDHELNVKETKAFTESGVSIGNCISITGADVDIGNCYVPSILIPSATYGGVATTGWCKTLPTDTEIALNSDFTGKKGNQLLIQYTGKDFTIYANATSPIANVFENADADTSKIYIDVNPKIFSATNDAQVTNGTVFSTGAFIQVLKANQMGVFQDYTWPTAANIKKGETSFDGSTTTTGTYNPPVGWFKKPQ